MWCENTISCILHAWLDAVIKAPTCKGDTTLQLKSCCLVCTGGWQAICNADKKWQVNFCQKCILVNNLCSKISELSHSFSLGTVCMRLVKLYSNHGTCHEWTYHKGSLTCQPGHTWMLPIKNVHVKRPPVGYPQLLHPQADVLQFMQQGFPDTARLLCMACNLQFSKQDEGHHCAVLCSPIHMKGTCGAQPWKQKCGTIQQ